MDLEGRLKRSGITIVGGIPKEFAVLDPDGKALRFIADLQNNFADEWHNLLSGREGRYQRFDDGQLPNFLPKTRNIREDKSWRVAKIPGDLLYRWVELTGPANDARMVRGALNSGANTWMADYEDALSPLWANILANTFNLHNAITRQRDFDPETGDLKLDENLATLITRPRGLHLPEAHMLVDGLPVSATIFDLGMIHHSLTPEQLRRGQTPAHYIPKLEHHLESAFVADLLTAISQEYNIPKGTIKTSILIENIMATFQVAEILYYMREYAIAANVGRWDQTASWYHVFRNHPDRGLPDRELVGMKLSFMMAYQKEVLRVCHERAAQPMGGMEANVPTREERGKDPGAYDNRIAAVRADARREAELGFYGKWSAHPATVALIQKEFKQAMDGEPSQPYKFPHEPSVTQAQLLETPEGQKTYDGMVSSAEEAIGYNAPWSRGLGAVALKGRMVDLATSEIARQELTHRLRHGTVLDDGRPVTEEMIAQVIATAVRNLMDRRGPKAFFEEGHGLGAQILADSIRLRPHYVPDTASKYLVLSSR